MYNCERRDPGVGIHVCKSRSCQTEEGPDEGPSNCAQIDDFSGRQRYEVAVCHGGAERGKHGVCSKQCALRCLERVLIEVADLMVLMIFHALLVSQSRVLLMMCSSLPQDV